MDDIHKEYTDLLKAGWRVLGTEKVGDSLRCKLINCENSEEREFLFTVNNTKASKMLQDLVQRVDKM